MTDLRLDRRQLVKAGLSAAVVAVLPAGCVRLSEDESLELLEVVSESPLPIDPGRVGSLSEESFRVLAGLAEYVDRGWELGGDLEAYVDRLRSDLDFKTGQDPSYLGEYEAAARLFTVVERRSETSDQAWAALLFGEADEADEAESPATRLGRARHFVFGELVTHQIAVSGGFRSFGLVNYTGWVGGPYTDPASYRRGEG